MLPRKILLGEKDNEIDLEEDINVKIDEEADDGQKTQSDEGLLNDKKVTTSKIDLANIMLE